MLTNGAASVRAPLTSLTAFRFSSASADPARRPTLARRSAASANVRSPRVALALYASPRGGSCRELTKPSPRPRCRRLRLAKRSPDAYPPARPCATRHDTRAGTPQGTRPGRHHDARVAAGKTPCMAGAHRGGETTARCAWSRPGNATPGETCVAGLSRAALRRAKAGCAQAAATAIFCLTMLARRRLLSPVRQDSDAALPCHPGQITVPRARSRASFP